MADHADGANDGDIFIYRGGRAPEHVTHVRIDKYVDEIEESAFEDCEHLVKVDTHDGLRKVGEVAFWGCRSLGRINLKSAVEIGCAAFYRCENLESVEFGDRLETILNNAFDRCRSLTHLKLPSVIAIAAYAFFKCTRLVDIELSERLETIGVDAFKYCERLQRIAIPLKRDLFERDVLPIDDVFQEYTQFDNCDQLATVDLVGGIHKTVASLHMDSWRTEMIAEINRINQVLPTIPADDKTGVIQQWMELVIDKIDHYKAEHCRYVKEGITLLELAVWKAKLDEKEESSVERKTKKAKVDAESARKERRITCGAGIVIKNVFPFLKLN
eukprot:scaffold409_cov143-Skeletonema_menzelii.AAC.1